MSRWIGELNQAPAARPYRPSNGTEGEIFHSAWCYRCALHGDEDGPIKPCEIQGNALAGLQPEEWTEDHRGPRCSTFTLDAAKDEGFDPQGALGLLL